MNKPIGTYALVSARGLLTLAFVGAGLAKLAGVEMMVATFDAVGIGQWFRYVTGIIEIGSAILLWLPGLQFAGAALLVVTMTGAVLTHVLLIGPTAVPATVLGILAAIVAYAYRDQATRIAGRLA